MKGLWLQDYYLFKRQRLAVGLTWGLTTLCLLWFGQWGIEIGMGIFAVMLSMLTLSLLSANQQNHGLKFLLTLPITKQTYLHQKYLLLFGSVGSAVLIMTGTTWVIARWQRWQLTLAAIFQQAYLVGILILAVLVIIVPYQLKHGPEATQTFMSVVGAAIGAIVGGSYLCVQRTAFGQNIFNQIAAIVTQHGLASLLLTITGLVVILLGYSYYRSMIGFHPSDA
ncbi:ABC-2 transporter permease [Levilactobacillus wangkuiensis]|uniref:ABC-2 transporter permease n=1 Tax=Levilactobacillus wangkuiensis TaxID=2799566 RepID=UPI001942D4FB|nr:ABC-2 transporter permease [Levilactobacillus wangkuiensis]